MDQSTPQVSRNQSAYPHVLGQRKRKAPLRLGHEQDELANENDHVFEPSRPSPRPRNRGRGRGRGRGNATTRQPVRGRGEGEGSGSSSSNRQREMNQAKWGRGVKL